MRFDEHACGLSARHTITRRIRPPFVFIADPLLFWSSSLICTTRHPHFYPSPTWFSSRQPSLRHPLHRLVRDIGFEGTGCAILLASASLLTLAVNGKTVEGARAVAERFVAMVTATSPPDGDGLGDPAVLAGVRDYPGRVKCATLPRHALRAATEGP